MIGIIGAGTMGKGIAIEFARFNHKVVLISVERHLSEQMLHDEVLRLTEKYSFENKDDIINNIETTNVYSDLINCNLIIEAVSENLGKKRNALNEAKEFINKSSIVASNTSSLSIQEIFDGIIPLDRVVGLHFFNPVQIMKLVELSYLDKSSELTTSKAKVYAESLEKEVVLVKNSPGFIVNRLLIPMINEAARIVDEGIATIEDIDRAMKFGANHPMGPLKLSDLIGNDITLAILNVLKEKNDNMEISNILKEKVKSSQLGRKSGIGFYEYRKK